MIDRPIYVNGRFLEQPITGVQRFAIEMIDALARIRRRGLTYITPARVSPTGRSIQPVGRLHGHLWEQLELPRYARDGILVNLCNAAPIQCKNQLVVIHDTGIFSFPVGYSWQYRAWYAFMQRNLVRSGARIATVSEFSKNEIIRQLGASPEQVTVVSEGANHISRILPDPSVLASHGLVPGRFVLAVGSLAPHKNLTALGHLARLLAARDMTLAITGGLRVEVFRSSGLPEPARYPGRVGDEELKALYESAACFVFPSLYEGFGLPAVEAMTCGCPVAAADIAALRETCGEAAIYFNPKSPDDVARQVLRVLDDVGLSDRLRRSGTERAAKYTWDRSACLLEGVIADVGRALSENRRVSRLPPLRL
jgi:glycosyltransferase involved in cell wall biosynthesis